MMKHNFASFFLADKDIGVSFLFKYELVISKKVIACLKK